MDTFLLALTIVFLAELGDKSQLMALVFAARYPVRSVLVGITAATMLVHGLSVGLGAALGAAIPARALSLAAAVAFVVFGVWTLWEGGEATDEQTGPPQRARSAAVAVATSVVLAELGDKTMLASATLATSRDPFAIWLGATIGMVTADALAIAVGRELGRRISPQVLRIGVALGFFGFAAVLAAQAR